MLELIVNEGETFDQETQTFSNSDKKHTVVLIHSLKSLSKWESIWLKPFIPPLKAGGKAEEKTADETFSYVKCMAVKRYPDHILQIAWLEHHARIQRYIADPHSATEIHHPPNQKPSRVTITSELIYYWMIAHGIPFECEKWHLDNLMKLIEICNIKNSDGNKMSKKEVASSNRDLNNARRAALKSKG